MITCDATKCRDCGICIDACPQGALQTGTDTTVAPVTAGKSQGGWSREQINQVRLKAATGKHIIRGCGSTKPLPTFDDLVLLQAQLSRMSVDTYREECATKTILGHRFARKPLVVETPILIGGMSYGALSKEAKIALAKGSAAVGTLMANGEGGLLQEERDAAYLELVQIAPSRYGFTRRNLELADALEITIGIGAKPGLSGHLMAEKITEEIAAFRGIPPHIDIHSHPRHSDIFGPDDLVMKLAELRELTDYQKPIFVKVAAGRVREDVKIAAKVGLDGIILDGMQGGTGAAPLVAIDHLGHPTLPALVQAVRALEEMGVKEEMSLIVAGGIKDGADVAKALALGADAVMIGTGAMVAMGCRVCLECHKGECQYGIGTQKPELRRRLHIEEAARGVANYLTAMTNELVILAKACGKSDVHNLEREDVRALTLEASAMTGIPVIGSDFSFIERFGFY